MRKGIKVVSAMASYKNGSYLQQSTSEEFDRVHDPGITAPYAGIYRCTKCGHEIAIAEGHKLPPADSSSAPDQSGGDKVAAYRLRATQQVDLTRRSAQDRRIIGCTKGTPQ
jgi:hypothetical protein